MILHALKVLLKMFIGFTGGVFAYFVFYFSWQYFAPTHFWVEYQGINSSGMIAGGKLELSSTSTYPRGGKITWSDQLRCNIPPENGNYKIYSSYVDTVSNIAKKETRTTSWLYQGVTPPVGTQCVMYSVVTVETTLGVKKSTQPIVSNVFVIKE